MLWEWHMEHYESKGHELEINEAAKAMGRSYGVHRSCKFCKSFGLV
jgi:hypothetical protein